MIIIAVNAARIMTPNRIPTAMPTFSPIPNASDEDAEARWLAETVSYDPVNVDVDVITANMDVGPKVDTGMAIDAEEVLLVTMVARRLSTICPLVSR